MENLQFTWARCLDLVVVGPVDLPSRSSLTIYTVKDLTRRTTMNPSRILTTRLACRRLTASVSRRSISSTPTRFNERVHPNAEEHRQYQKEKPDNPHMTNTNSTFHNEMPSLGKDKPPPDMISSVDPDYVPKDKVPENTERMTGGTQSGDPDKVSRPDVAVGEIEGISFRVEPLRRTGEDVTTMRARLLCRF